MKKIRQFFILAIWLTLWQMAAMAVDHSILLPGPWDTLKALCGSLFIVAFWRIVGSSLLRISAGFLAGFLAGILLAAVSKRFLVAKEFLSPFITMLKAIPVASFVVLLLIWWGSAFLATAVSFLIVMPQIYVSTLEGLHNTDVKMQELTKVFRFSGKMKFWFIYRAAVKPFVGSSIKIAAGMSFKSGVAAELIGRPDYSLGDRLYFAKIHLDTESLFAWTLVIILVSFLFEKLACTAWNHFAKAEPNVEMWNRNTIWKRAALIFSPKEKSLMPETEDVVLELQDVYKSFDEKKVLESKSAVFKRGEIYFLTEPSGSGKTTTLRLLAGLETPEKGSVIRNGRISMVFQEDRLFEEYSAATNIAMVCGNYAQAADSLENLISREDAALPCRSLSGGMKRRAAVVRAMQSESEAVLLDEPFTGLDEANRRKVIAYILREQKGRCLIIAAHNMEDIRLLKGEE